jgi:hypothetical protein
VRAASRSADDREAAAARGGRLGRICNHRFNRKNASSLNVVLPRAGIGAQPARGAIGPIEEKSITRNAIADCANSAATCASAQGNHLSLADKEAATPTDGARADRLAYE